MIIELKDGWLADANGNKASIDYFGTEAAASEALQSLEDCKNCINCSDCSRCSDCSHIAFLWDKKDLQAEPSDTPVGQPAIPIIENIHTKVYGAVSQPNALDMSTWHTCNTTHCRAGWVVHWAGEAGYALERFHNTPLAAQLIYRESGFLINPCRFYETDNEIALADMKKLAEA